MEYMFDADGRKTGVILSIEEYEEILDDLADLAVIAERKDESTIPHDQVVAELKKDGFLPD